MSQPPSPPGDAGWGQPAPQPGPGWGAPPQPGFDPSAGQAAPPGYGPPPGQAPPAGQPGYPPQPGFGAQPGQVPPPGYGPQPGFGGPPGYGGPPKKSSPLVPILVVLAVVAVVAVGAFVVFSGDDEGGGGDPEAAAVRYVEAVIDRDCGGVRDAMAIPEAAVDGFMSECESMFSGDVPEDVGRMLPTEVLSTTVESETDTEATVSVEYRMGDGETSSETLDLTKGDDGWLVAFEDVGVDVPDVPDVDVPDSDDPFDDGGSDDAPAGLGDPTEPPLDSEEALDDPSLVEYANDCYAGDMAACDDLWLNTDVGGELEAYAESCGGRVPGGGLSNDCEETYG